MCAERPLPQEGLAVVLLNDDEVAVVKHAENEEKQVRFGAHDLPRETRSRNFRGNFEPLPKTLERTMREELGIDDWKGAGIKPVRYTTMMCERPNGDAIKAHIVVMNCPYPILDLIDKNLLDTTEIVDITTQQLSEVLTGTDDSWRKGPDGRDLARAAFPEETKNLHRQTVNSSQLSVTFSHD